MFRKNDLIMLIVVFGSMAAGLAWPELFLPLVGATSVSVMALLFLSFLKISPRDVWASLKRYPGRLSLLTVVKLAVLPILVYSLAHRLAPDYTLGLLFLAGVSTGVTAPFFTGLAGGAVPIALVMAVVTTLLLPLSLPAMVKLLVGQSLGFDLDHLAGLLSLFIFVPLVAAGLGRRFTPGLCRRCERASFPISMTLFAVINLGSFAKYAPFLTASLGDILWAGLLAAALCLFATALGAAILWRPVPDRVASAGSLGWINNVLIIVLGAQLGDPLTSVLGALYLVPTFVLIVPLSWLARGDGLG